MKMNLNYALPFRLLLILGAALSPVRIFAQEIRHRALEPTYSQQELNNLFQQVAAIFPQRISPEIRVLDAEPPTCATMLLMDARRHLENFSPQQRALLLKLLARPILPLSILSPSGKFKIHYDVSGGNAVPAADLDGSGVPDFVEAVGQALDESYDLQVNELGYDPAPDDNGIAGPEYDVYLENLGRGLYGFTQGETRISVTQNNYTSYIVMDNDFNNNHFTTGVNGARVTAAHEYFHAIQFGYRIFDNDDEPFYYELCSTWMEDVAYDDINDYFQYLPSFFGRTDIPFNHFTGTAHTYGRALWNHFLVKRFDDIDLVRRSWEIMRSGELAVAAIDRSLIEKGSRLKNAFAEFAFWNYFTGPNRADAARYYEEGAQYPEIRFSGNFLIASDTTIVDSSLALTTKYFKFTTTRAGEYAITGAVDDPANWSFGAVINGTGVDDLHLFNIQNGQNLGFLPEFTEIVVTPINQLVLDGDNLPQLNVRYARFQFNLVRGSIGGESRGITNIFPNPFIIGNHSRVFFEFAPANTSNLEARILDSNGRVLKTVKFRDGDPSLNQSFFAWDPAANLGSTLASGIYLFVLKQDSFVDVRKFAIVRK
jgi:hypothetical protein